MSKEIAMTRGRARSWFLAAAMLCLGAASLKSVEAEIIWSGGFETGSFTQWHFPEKPSEVHFHLIPPYGRPIQYGGQNSLHVGDGSLLSLVSADGRTVNGVHYPVGPTRGGSYAAKFTVKNSRNGSEPNDCDVTVYCERRRTELTMQQALMDSYSGMPYLGERWASVSVYVPSDWDLSAGSGWGPVIYNIKPRVEPNGSSSSAFAIELQSGRSGLGYWKIWHRWLGEANPESFLWQYQMFYAGDEGGAPYPRSNNWPDGLNDFPNVADSHAALQSVRKGGWTDWVLRVRWDERGASKGGTGSLTLWKREGSGPWVEVLHILPKTTTRGGMTFDHGIGYLAPAGYGPKLGMYMARSQVWDLPANRVLYFGNIKVGSDKATFSQMSHDGSSPGQSLAKPAPPSITTVQ